MIPLTRTMRWTPLRSRKRLQLELIDLGGIHDTADQDNEVDTAEIP
jgi:hypothetical protein